MNDVFLKPVNHEILINNIILHVVILTRCQSCVVWGFWPVCWGYVDPVSVDQIWICHRSVAVPLRTSATPASKIKKIKINPKKDEKNIFWNLVVLPLQVNHVISINSFLISVWWSFKPFTGDGIDRRGSRQPSDQRAIYPYMDEPNLVSSSANCRQGLTDPWSVQQCTNLHGVVGAVQNECVFTLEKMIDFVNLTLTISACGVTSQITLNANLQQR